MKVWDVPGIRRARTARASYITPIASNLHWSDHERGQGECCCAVGYSKRAWDYEKMITLAKYRLGGPGQEPRSQG